MRARTSPHGTDFGPYTVLDLHELPEDGKGFELEDGWLIEVAASPRHNWALRTVATPRSSVQVLTLADGAYTAHPAVIEGNRLEMVIDADKPVTVSFDPADLLAF